MATDCLSTKYYQAHGLCPGSLLTVVKPRTGRCLSVFGVKLELWRKDLFYMPPLEKISGIEEWGKQAGSRAEVLGPAECMDMPTQHFAD